MATRILILEDNPGDRRKLEAALRAANPTWDILLHDQLSTAVGADHIDVAFIDANVRDYEGKSTFEMYALAQPEVAIIAYTGILDPRVLRQLADDGFIVGELNKDTEWRAGHLTALVRDAVERKRSFDASATPQRTQLAASWLPPPPTRPMVDMTPAPKTPAAGAVPVEPIGNREVSVVSLKNQPLTIGRLQALIGGVLALLPAVIIGLGGYSAWVHLTRDVAEQTHAMKAMLTEVQGIRNDLRSLDTWKKLHENGQHPTSKAAQKSHTESIEELNKWQTRLCIRNPRVKCPEE